MKSSLMDLPEVFGLYIVVLAIYKTRPGRIFYER
jgi:hypothetical protein